MTGLYEFRRTPRQGLAALNVTKILKKSAVRLAFFVKKGFEVTWNRNNCVYLCIETGSEDNPEQG